MYSVRNTIANIQMVVHTSRLKSVVWAIHDALVAAELSCLSDAKDDVIAEY
jgi:hypothetical protein